jgi:hypothetical protein
VGAMYLRDERVPGLKFARNIERSQDISHAGPLLAKCAQQARFCCNIHSLPTKPGLVRCRMQTDERRFARQWDELVALASSENDPQKLALLSKELVQLLQERESKPKRRAAIA